MEYLDTILSKDYKVVYHFSDIKEYYVLSLSDDKLSSVLKKYYNKWNNEFDNVYNDNLKDCIRFLSDSDGSYTSYNTCCCCGTHILSDEGM